MNHDYIERFDLVDQYLMGRLSMEESARFEEHFVDCPQCVDQLQVTRSFRRDLRLAAAQQASEADSPRKWRPSILSNVANQRSWALAAGCLLLLIGVSTIFVFQMRRLRNNVDDAKSVVAQLEQRFEEQKQLASMAENKRQELEESLTGRINELRVQVQIAQTQRADMGAESARSGQPIINLADLETFMLRSLRGGPINEITPPPSPGMYSISVPLEGELNHDGYLITISRDRKRVWGMRYKLKPPYLGPLDLLFHSDSLLPGRYVFKVSGISKSGQESVIGNYPVLIKKR